MSLYRFARLTAILALLRRYRGGLLRMLFAVGFALVTAWLYDDVAVFIAAQHPAWAGPALIIKSLIVYAALFLCFWEVGRMARGQDRAPAARRPAATPATRAADESPSTLERLARKPELASRRDALLDRDQRQG